GYTLQGSSSSSSKFTCSGTGTAVTCTSVSGQVVAVGSPETIHLTVKVPANSAVSVINSATAYGGGDPVHTSGNPTSPAATDTVTVIQVPTTVSISAAIQTQSATILTAFANPLVVTIKDAGGVAIANYGASYGSISYAAST